MCIRDSPHLIQRIQVQIFEFLGRPLDLDVGYSFSEFLDYLSDRKQAGYERVNIHFLPQVSQQTDLSLDAFYRIEDDVEHMLAIYRDVFADDDTRYAHAAHLCDTLGTQKMNRTIHRLDTRKIHEGFVGDADFAQLNDLRKRNFTFDYGSFYDEATRAKVKLIANDELARYEYDFPY